MRKLLLILGIALLIFGLYPFVKYIADFDILSSYGKGFVMGKILIFLLGGFLMFFSFRMKSKDTA